MTVGVLAATWGASALAMGGAYVRLVPPFDQDSVFHPTAAKVIAGTIFGVGTATGTLLAAGVISAAALGTAMLAVKAVSWITASGSVAAGVGMAAEGLVTVVGLISFNLGLQRFKVAIIGSAISLSERAAVWLVNSVSALSWQSLLLNARSVCGLVTAEELNNLDDNNLSHVNARILKQLSFEEFCKIENRVANALSPNDLADVEAHFKPMLEAEQRYERLNSLAEAGESVPVDDINSLCGFELKFLASEVIGSLSEDDVGRLSSHVLNGLSTLAIAELMPRVVTHLSPAALNGLEPRVLNGFSFDLARGLPEEVQQHLSVKPVRWNARLSLDDVPAVNIKGQIREGRRLYWVPKYYQDDGAVNSNNRPMSHARRLGRINDQVDIGVVNDLAYIRVVNGQIQIRFI